VAYTNVFQFLNNKLYKKLELFHEHRHQHGAILMRTPQIRESK